MRLRTALTEAHRPAVRSLPPAPAGRAVGRCYHCGDWATGRLHSVVDDRFVFVTGHPGCPKGRPRPGRRG